MPSEHVDSFKRDIHWPTVLYYIHLHALGLYGLLLLFTEAKWMTVFFTLFIILFSALGITAGAHRLWAHGSYEASAFIRIVLAVGHTLAGVGNIYDWVLQHRTHHKYYGTERDPYNHKKGLFYSHVVSNMLARHPAHDRLARDIDMCDVDYDLIVWVQRWFYWIAFPVIGLLLPLNAPVEYWGESFMNSLFILGFFRLAVTANLSWLVNSSMLIWGLKPGDKLRAFIDTIGILYMLLFNMPKNHGNVMIDPSGFYTALFPSDDNMIFLLNKSYWPNYHYMLPWDYKCGEFGTYDRGCATFFIKTWENLGLVDSLKSASSEAIRDALYKATSKKVDFSETLESVKRIADDEAIRAKLRYKH